MVEVKGTVQLDGRRSGQPFDAEALGKVLDRNPSGHMYHFRYPLDGANGAGLRQGLHRRRHHAARDDAGRHGASPCIPRTSATRT